MDDDGDMAEMYLTEKKERMDAYSSSDPYFHSYSSLPTVVSKSAPVSPVGSITESYTLERTSSKSSKHGSFRSSSSRGEHIQEIEMLLEAYFIVIDNTLNKLLSLKEFIDDTEDFINIKLDNVQNQLIQFELLLTAATFICAIFAVVTGVFGMNFTPPFLDKPYNFNWVLLVTGILCAVFYSLFLLYFKYKRLLPV